MSRTVDNRVVELQFKNEQFIKAVTDSINSIESFERTVKTMESAAHLKNLDRTVSSIDFSTMKSSLSTISDRFSTLGVIGMSAINTIASAVTNKLIVAFENLGSIVGSVWNQIVEGGERRAKNIEQASFSLQGLLSTEYGDDVNTIKQKTKEISNVIDESVTDTQYTYDAAAKAASTMVATYGTSAAGIKKTSDALKGIVGVAAQTGASYEQVSQVFSTVAGNGRAMAMQFNQVASYGMNAAKTIADYLNAEGNKGILKKLKEEAVERDSKGRIKKRLIEGEKVTEAEVRKLASKSFITADIWNNAFIPFYENASKANSTLSGVTANINAALSRLGAAFIQPIIKNEGPLVNFLNVVRQKTKDFLNLLIKFDIPTNITNTISTFLEGMANALDRLDLSKITLFEKLGNAIEIVSTAFNQKQDIKEKSVIDSLLKDLEDRQDKLEKSRKTYTDIVRDITGIKDLTYEKLVNADKKTTKQLQDQGIDIESLISEVRDQYKKQNEELDKGFSELEDLRKSYGERIEQIKDMTDVWHYDYFADITDAIYNFGDALKTIFGTIFNTVGELSGLFEPVSDLFEDKDKGAYTFRKIINDIAKGFKDFSERVKDFVKNNTSFQNVLKGISSIFAIIIKVGIAIKDIFVNAFNSLKPLFIRIGKLFGVFGDFFTELTEAGNDVDVLGKIVSIVSKVIDGLAKVLIKAWDGLEGFILKLTGKGSATEAAKSLGEGLSTVAGKVSSFIDRIVDAVGGFFKFMGGESKEKEGSGIFSVIKELLAGIFSSGDKGINSSDLDKTEEVIERVGDIADTTSDTLERIGDANETAKSLPGSDFFEKLLDKISEGILDFDVDTFIDRLDKVSDIVLKIAAAIGILLGGKGVKSGFGIESLFKKAGDALTSLGTKGIPSINNGMKTVNTAINGLTAVLSKFSLVDAVKEYQKPKKWEAIASMLKSIATIILMLGISLLLVSVSVYILSKIPVNDLIKGGIALGAIFIAIAGIMTVLLLFTAKLKGADTGTTIGKLADRSTNSASGILGSMAAVIAAIGVAVYIIAKALKIVSNIPEQQLKNGEGALAVIGIILGVLLIEIMVLVNRILDTEKADKDNPMFTKNGKKSMVAIIGAAAGALATIGGAVKTMAEALKTLSKLSSNEIENGTIAMTSIGAILGILLAEVILLVDLIMSRSNDVMDENKVTKTLLTVAGTIFILGIVISAIMLSLAIVASLPTKNMDNAIEALITVSAVIIVLTGMAVLLTKFAKDDVTKVAETMTMMSLLLATLSLFAISLGAMMALFGAAGLDASGIQKVMDSLLIVIISIMGVATIIGLIASKVPEIEAGIAVISLLFISMGAWALMIGMGVLLVGAGLIMLGDAIEKFFSIFENVNEERQARVIGGLTGFILGLVGVFVNGFVELLTLLDKLKKPIMKALISLISFGFEALMAWIPAGFQSLLNTASVCIDLLSIFLDDNHDKIVNIIDKLFDIIWEAMTVNSMSFLALVTGLLMQMRITLFGEDGEGGEMIAWTNAILNFIDQLIQKLIMRCVNMMYWGLDYIQAEAPVMADKLGETAEVLLDGFANALVEHGPKIIDKIKLIGKIIPRLLLYAMGIGPAPEMGEFGSAGEKGKNPSDSGKEYLTSVSGGFKITETIRKKINDVVTGMVNTFKSLAWMFNPIGNLFASKLATGMNAELKIKSPSKVSEETAYWYVKGAEKGVVKNAHIAADSAADMARGMIVATDNEFNKGFKELKENNSDIIDYLLGTDTANNTQGTRLDKLIASAGAELKKLFTDFSFLDNLEFTITPDMDLTKITEGMDSITSMFGNTNEEINVDSVNANTVKASGIETLLSKINPLGDISDPNNANNVVVNLTQNNYSPESLSRIDIYRDTKNLLSSTPSIVSSNLPV